MFSQIFGFRKGSLSTNETTYKYTPEMLKALNIRIYFAEVFSDLSKDFDCVSHRILQHFLIMEMQANGLNCILQTGKVELH
jgi:hypothetical protein